MVNFLKELINKFLIHINFFEKLRLKIENLKKDFKKIIKIP